MASETEVEGIASLGWPPWPEPDEPPGVSKASLGFSSCWICGGAGPGERVGGSLGPLSFAYVGSIFGGSIMGGGGAGLATGVGGGCNARGRVVEGRGDGDSTRCCGSRPSTVNVLLTFAVLGSFCVGSFGRTRDVGGDCEQNHQTHDVGDDGKRARAPGARLISSGIPSQKQVEIFCLL